MAQEYYNKKFTRGERFLYHARIDYDDKEYVESSFFLHQAAEYFIKTIPLVYSLYGYKEHDLHFLCERSKPFTTELANVFPCDSEEEKRLFELLRAAYIEARYNDKFVVTKADIDALLPLSLIHIWNAFRRRSSGGKKVGRAYFQLPKRELPPF